MCGGEDKRKGGRDYRCDWAHNMGQDMARF